MAANSNGEQHWDQEIDRLKRGGYSQNKIAKKLGVSRSYVSQRVNANTDIFRSMRDRMRVEWPIKTNAFIQSYKERNLRDHLEYQMSLGESMENEKGMSQVKLDRLNRFYHNLIDNNLVVEFDPSITSDSGDSVGGYAFRTRNASDRDLVLRENRHVKMDKRQRVLWAIPPILPNGERS